MASRREAFAAWRRVRPFWGATLAIAAGLEIYSVAMAPMKVVVMQGLPGLLTIFIALVAVIMGAITLAQPPQRVITGWVILVLGPLSILATNLGGFVIGMILLVVGGSLVLSWEPLGATDGEFDEPRPAEELTPVAAAGYETEQTVADPYESSSDHSYDDSYQGSHRSSSWADDAETDSEAETVPVAEPVAEPVSRSAFDSDYSYPSTTSTSSYAADSYATSSYEPEPVAEPVPDPVPEPVAAAPATSAAPAAPAEDEDDEPVRLRNPWRSRIPAPAPTEPSELDPPKLQVRSTLLIPLVIAAIAVSGILAAPAQAAGNAQAGLFDWLLNPAQPAPSASASPSPSASPSASASAGTGGGTTIGGITIPGLGGGKKSTDDADVKAAASCPDTIGGATVPGDAATKAASEVKACAAAEKAAGDGTVKKAAAPDDLVVANDTSTLNATRLTLSGFAYQGTTTVTKANGDTLKVLKMHASKLVVKGMDQSYTFDGHTVSLKDAKDDVTIYNVDLYVKKMTGNVFGILPLTFTPDLPNLELPALPLDIFITNGSAEVALVKADKITLPTLVSTVK